EAELAEIGSALGSGWIQVISDFDDPEQEFAMLRRVAAQSGRPLAITVLQRDSRPEAWRELMQRVSAARADGLGMIGQVIGRPTGVLLGFEISTNPFSGRPSWEAIAHLPLAEKLVHLRDPAFRERLIAETNRSSVFAKRVSSWERIFPFGDPPDYEPAPSQSIAAIAEREGRAPEQVAYDMLLADEGRAILYRPLSNYAYGNLDTVYDMITHPDTIVSLGDGGAHVGVLTDASAITYLLTHWTRDRSRGEKLPLEWAVKRLSSDNARAIGLLDRGRVAVGAKADLNVIDYDRLSLHAPEVAYDLPGGGRRLLQRTSGYELTLLSGRPVYREGEPSGELPGRLVRGARASS
ncbi:MAG: amidohydrolase family protein, partial [Gammaproteobacteria bacterium]|nr:amidohydrolase family protein [Gammaproteobacteria bacterium]